MDFMCVHLCVFVYVVAVVVYVSVCSELLMKMDVGNGSCVTEKDDKLSCDS